MSVAGDLALVSAYVYGGLPRIFRNDGSRWTEEHILAPTSLGGFFGRAAALDGDTAIVGKIFDGCPPGRPACGSALVFEGLSSPGCPSGTVNTGIGSATDVLFVNGSPGDLHRAVDVALNEPITVTMNAAPGGPDPGFYGVWGWVGVPTGCFELIANGSSIGCFLYPTPLHISKAPQPIRCFKSSGLPNAFCGGTTEIPGPTEVPFTITRNNGIRVEGDFVLQAVIADDGASNPTGYSVTNAILLRVR